MLPLNRLNLGKILYKARLKKNHPFHMRNRRRSRGSQYHQTENQNFTSKFVTSTSDSKRRFFDFPHCTCIRRTQQHNFQLPHRFMKKNQIRTCHFLSHVTAEGITSVKVVPSWMPMIFWKWATVRIRRKHYMQSEENEKSGLNRGKARKCLAAVTVVHHNLKTRH